MNGLVLGNDPAVHLEKALLFLQSGNIPLSNLGWTPPLYSIMLAVFISFTGASSLEQLIIVEKVAAVMIDWLLFFSVYILGSKFFGRRVGATASVLLLMSFPLFELNQWGGYTTVLAIAFMLLIFLYTPLATEKFGYLVVAFFAAFGLVLSHQLATFLAVFMMPPILLFMLVKSKGAHLKVVVALALGGGIAFFLYYFQAIIPYIDLVIEYVFFAIKEYAYQIPATSFNSFMVNFGFSLFLALGGIVVAYHHLLRSHRRPLFYLILMLSFSVPLFFAESYLVGLFLPFQWFVYYLIPPIAILAAVTLVSAFDKVQSFYLKNRISVRKVWVKVATVIIVVLVASMIVFRFGTVYGKIMEASVFYSTSDPKALEAGLWLKNNYPENVTVVDTDVPGFWFRLYSGKPVIAATNPIIQRNEISESILDLSYEIEKSFEAEKPLTLIRAYEAKGAISHESFVSLNRVWNRVAFSSGDGDKVLYQDNGVDKEPDLGSFGREIIFNDADNSSKQLLIRYFNDDVAINQTITVNDNSYATAVSWAASPLRSGISNIALYMSIFLDLHFNFDEAYVPGILDWENPWNHPSETSENGWAVTNFSNSTLTDRYLGFYDGNEDIIYALRFGELPEWGNVGVLASRQVDAVRFLYNFSDLSPAQNSSFSYSFLTFSKSSYSAMPVQPIDVESLFNLKTAKPFVLESRDYRYYIKQEDIGFIVYDKNQLDTKIVKCKLLELVYSNDRYAIFKIKNTP